MRGARQPARHARQDEHEIGAATSLLGRLVEQVVDPAVEPLPQKALIYSPELALLQARQLYKAVRDGNRAGTPARGNCLADGNRSVSPTRPQAWRKAAQPMPHAYLGHKQATRGPAASGQRREAERVCVSASATLVIEAPRTQHARHGQAPANSLYQQPVDSLHTSYSRAETRTRRNVTRTNGTNGPGPASLKPNFDT
jgi:hypothetical protein